MTWEELKEKAKKMGAVVLSDMVIYNSVMFLENGEIDMSRRIFSAEQTHAIMKALQTKEEDNV